MRAEPWDWSIRIMDHLRSVAPILNIIYLCMYVYLDVVYKCISKHLYFYYINVQIDRLLIGHFELMLILNQQCGEK